MPNARISNSFPNAKLRNDVSNVRITNKSGTNVSLTFGGIGYLIGFPLAYTYEGVQNTTETVFGDPPHARIVNI